MSLKTNVRWGPWELSLISPAVQTFWMPWWSWICKHQSLQSYRHQLLNYWHVMPDSESIAPTWSAAVLLMGGGRGLSQVEMVFPCYSEVWNQEWKLFSVLRHILADINGSDSKIQPFSQCQQVRFIFCLVTVFSLPSLIYKISLKGTCNTEYRTDTNRQPSSHSINKPSQATFNLILQKFCFAMLS